MINLAKVELRLLKQRVLHFKEAQDILRSCLRSIQFRCERAETFASDGDVRRTIGFIRRLAAVALDTPDINITGETKGDKG